MRKVAVKFFVARDVHLALVTSNYFQYLRLLFSVSGTIMHIYKYIRASCQTAVCVCVYVLSRSMEKYLIILNVREWLDVP